jgi:hypothetical protein
MVLLFFHGAAGGWDELLIAIVAFGVLWLAVKLAGRKSADDDEDTDLDEVELAEREANVSAAHQGGSGTSR